MPNIGVTLQGFPLYPCYYFGKALKTFIIECFPNIMFKLQNILKFTHWLRNYDNVSFGVSKTLDFANMLSNHRVGLLSTS